MGQREGSPMWSPAVVISVLSMLRLATAAQYTVGDGDGWAMNVNYTDWAAKHTFYEGDRVVFSYSRGTHDVLRVSAKDYDSCSVSNPIETDASGQTTYELRAGDYYFICGFPAHCRQSQKVFFRVQPPAGSASTLITPIVGLPDYAAEGPAGAYGPSGAFAPGAAPASLVSMQSLVLLIFGGLLVGCAPLF